MFPTVNLLYLRNRRSDLLKTNAVGKVCSSSRNVVSSYTMLRCTQTARIDHLRRPPVSTNVPNVGRYFGKTPSATSNGRSVAKNRPIGKPRPDSESPRSPLSRLVDSQSSICKFGARILAPKRGERNFSGIFVPKFDVWPNIGPIVRKTRKSAKVTLKPMFRKKFEATENNFFLQLCSVVFGREVWGIFLAFLAALGHFSPNARKKMPRKVPIRWTCPRRFF